MIGLNFSTWQPLAAVSCLGNLAHDAAVVKKLPLIFRTIPGKNLGENA
jgi:hypothetical protein